MRGQLDERNRRPVDRSFDFGGLQQGSITEIHAVVNVWLTAISANWNHQGDQIPSKAEYDYFRYYAPVKD